MQISYTLKNKTVDFTIATTINQAIIKIFYLNKKLFIENVN